MTPSPDALPRRPRSSSAAPQELDLPRPDSLAARLFPPLTTPTEWKLERVEAALDALGRPHRAYPALHAGGTNGKGSVVSVWDAVLRRSGLRTGLYTSPHLVSFNERFRIDGRPLPDDALLEAAGEIREVVQSHALTFFEASTLLAFHLLRRNGVDVAVVEVGLGGRLDATNVLRPEVAVVTNVAVDHAEYLGESREEIAVEKAGIAKPGVPLVTAEADPEIVGVLRAETVRRGGVFHHLDVPALLRSAKGSAQGSRFRMETESWGEVELSPSLIGAHQVGNVALAVRALDLLEPPLRPSAEAVREGVEDARCAGRLEVHRSHGTTWIFDVAHNPSAVRAVVEALDALELPRPRAVVFGCLSDKDWGGMIPLLEGWAGAVVLARPPGAPPGRTWDPSEAVDRVPASTRLSLEVAHDLAGALKRSAELAGGTGSVLVTGSHALVGAALLELEIRTAPAP